MALQEAANMNTLVPTPEQLQERMIGRLAARDIEVLAIPSDLNERSMAITMHLGIRETVVAGDVDDALKAADELHIGRPVAAVVEIENAQHEIPSAIVNGREIRVLDHVLSLPSERRLGKIILESADGASALALITGRRMAPNRL